MSDVVLDVQGLVKSFGALTATDQVDLRVERGTIHAVIGPNGAGKSTLIHQLAGELRPDRGRVVLDGVDVTRELPHRRALAGLGRSYQITSVFPEFTALQNVMLAVQAKAGHSFGFWRPTCREAALVEPAKAALARVGLADRAHAEASVLAHGERRQLEIAMALVAEPKLLLLDEPMAGMSQRESENVVTLLRSLKGRYSVLLVEHDMDAVFGLADRITVLVYGRVIATGSVAEIRENREVRRAYLGEEDVAA